jgi:hypothetical protein
MTKHVFLLLVSLCLVIGVNPQAKAQDIEPSAAALTFVAAFSDDHLAGMLSRFAGRDPRLAAFAQVDGRAVASTLDTAIALAVREHSADWQRNMARAWTPLLSEEELVSLTTAGAQSPHVDKYLELRPAAGQAMQTYSQDLFREILSDVLDTTVAALADNAAPAPSDPAHPSPSQPAPAPVPTE